MEIIFEFLAEIFFEIIIEGIGALGYAFVSNRKIPYAVKVLIYLIIMALLGVITYYISANAYRITGIVGGVICGIIGVSFMIIISRICVKGYEKAKREWEKEETEKSYNG